MSGLHANDNRLFNCHETYRIQDYRCELTELALTDPVDGEVLQFSGVPEIHFFVNRFMVCEQRLATKRDHPAGRPVSH